MEGKDRNVVMDNCEKKCPIGDILGSQGIQIDTICRLIFSKVMFSMWQEGAFELLRALIVPPAHWEGYNLQTVIS
jgi:hypothetical protein